MTRWILAPFCPTHEDDLQRIIDDAASQPLESLALLQEHGLALLWADAIKTRHGRQLPAALEAPLRSLRRQEAMKELAQRACEARATAALDAHQIDYIVFKGAHFKRSIYTSPEFRPSLDVDVLVHHDRRHEAISALSATGFEALDGETNLSHELNLTDGHAFIDLHWRLVRPGRAKIAMAPEVLRRRVRLGDTYVPCAADALAIMLFHTALADQVSARLSRAIDIAYLAASAPEAWDEATSLLERAGLKAAAWATLSWVRGLVPMEIPKSVERHLAPGILQRTYLKRWIAADPGHLYRDHPLLVRVAFNLALVDGLPGALRALGALYRAKRSASAEGAAIRESTRPRRH